MSVLATPAPFSVSMRAFALVLASLRASAADGRSTLTPRLTVTVSGMPVTTPTPSTVTVGGPPGVAAAFVAGAVVGGRDVGDWAVAVRGPSWTAASTPAVS